MPWSMRFVIAPWGVRGLGGRGLKESWLKKFPKIWSFRMSTGTKSDSSMVRPRYVLVADLERLKLIQAPSRRSISPTDSPGTGESFAAKFLKSLNELRKQHSLRSARRKPMILNLEADGRIVRTISDLRETSRKSSGYI